MYEYSFNCQKEYLESVEPMKHVLIAAARRDEPVNILSILFPDISRVHLGSVSLGWLAMLRGPTFRLT